MQKIRLLLMTGLLAAAVLAGCATTEGYEKKLNVWIGKSEKELVSAWGIPDKQFQVDTHTKMYSYVLHNTVIYPGTPATCTGSVAGKNGTVVNNCFGGAAPEVTTTHCETLFTLVDNKVTRWGHRGNDCRSE